MALGSSFIGPAVGLAATVILGFGLSRLGKPYAGWLFNAHKLTGLAMVIWMGARFAKPLKAGGAPLMVCVALAGLGALALFASGALLSIGKFSPTAALWAHRAGAVVGIGAALTALWMTVRA